MKTRITKYAFVVAVALILCSSGCDDILGAGMLIPSFSGGYGGYGEYEGYGGYEGYGWRSGYGDSLIRGLNRWDHVILDTRPSLEPGCVDTYFYDIVTGTYRSGKVCGS